MRFYVYACDHYVHGGERVCIGCGLTREGARQIILDYRRFGMLGAQCDIVHESPRKQQQGETAIGLYSASASHSCSFRDPRKSGGDA